MRTIRIKLYKYEELSKAAQEKAILPFMSKYVSTVGVEHAKRLAVKDIYANGYEFTQEGNHIPVPPKKN